MSTHLTGKGSSNGIAIGPPFLWKFQAAVAKEKIQPHQIPLEIERLRKAFETAKYDWERALIQRVAPTKETTAILKSYLQLIQDRLLWSTAKQFIEQKEVNAAWALEKTKKLLEQNIGSQESLLDVIHKLTEMLESKNPLLLLHQSIPAGSILAVHHLSPAAIAALPHGAVAGILMERGTDTSHNMILARGLGIPAVSGILELFLHLTPETLIILDGFHNKVILNPTPEEVEEHVVLHKKHQILEKMFLSQAQTKAITTDHYPIHVAANIELPQEADWLQKYGAEGIGLFRSESLYWDLNHPPSYENQVALYRSLIRSAGKYPVTIRTFDIEEENPLMDKMRNPALGLRGIRFGLYEKNLLQTQLSALAKVSEDGPLRVLLPMVTAIEEFDIVLKLLPTPHQLKLGVMIETPALLWMLDELLEKVDFLAIGTNDLMQYTLACDRNYEQISSFRCEFHPALFRSLKHIVQKANAHRKEVTLCGEVLLDPALMPVCIGLGINSFSVNLRRIPKIKKWVRSLSFEACANLAERLLKMSNSLEIAKLLETTTLGLDTPDTPR